MFKSLLSLLVGFFVSSCGSSKASGKDTFFWTKKHISFVEQTKIWERSESEIHAYFGLDYRNFDDSMQKYSADPLGPIVGVWKTIGYVGGKPNFTDCGERTKSIESAYGTPEYEKEMKEVVLLQDKYWSCLSSNEELKENSAVIKYYYARSKSNYRPTMPLRPEGHALYEANMAFGPLGGIPLEKLNKEHQKIKDQLDRWHCWDLYSHNDPKECYRLPGNESSIYYKVRSILKEPEVTEGMASAPWESPDFIHNSPYNWEEIEGVEINKTQYDYMYEKFKKSPTKPIIFRLDSDAPDLNEEQKSYIKATEWDADTNEEAYQSLLKEFYGR